MHICMDEINMAIALVRDFVYAIPIIRLKIGI